ncbi:MAG: succinate dehydrogenase assembly factor 2 [Proteobacteria bacterium]|nr:succinate dehydrogenase assembly factor 2 [Pseudomonadota bacterium]MBI3498844.1 succinate dehydrogenase assembly factor 2 [Pseudomonadota bacterium]
MQSDVRRKRLLFRSSHTGTKEMDLFLGAFAEAHLAAMTDAQLSRYEALLEIDDPTLYAWITGRQAPPPGQESDVLELIRSFKYRPY